MLQSLWCYLLVLLMIIKLSNDFEKMNALCCVQVIATLFYSNSLFGANVEFDYFIKLIWEIIEWKKEAVSTLEAHFSLDNYPIV